MTRSIGLLAVLAALAVAPAAALAQAAPASTIKVDLKGAAAQDLVLPKGKSAIIELPIDVRDAHVTDSAVADVELPYARRVYVMGIASGQTDAVFFDAAGRRILSLNIRVQPDLTGFAETVTRVAPSAHVEAEAVNDRVILTGHVANMADADKVMRVAASYVSKPENVLNMMTVTGKDQVLLKVRIVEMQRSVLKQFGISTDLLLREPGHLQFSYSNNATFPVNGTVQAGLNVTGTKLTGANNLNQTTAGIQAFERVGVVRTLAEPNLTAVSGESAKFLAGGEFPVPSAVDNAGRVTVTFKSFGVGLGFVPVVLSDGRISLKISTEVSDINPIGSFSLGTGSANGPTLSVPGLSVRRAETSVELTSGSQMMIAGLLRDDTRQNVDGIPGLKDIDVLGALFRSRDYQTGQTELVVMVSAYVVDPVGPGKLQTPVDGMVVANDAEAILMGRLNKAYKVTPPAGRTYQGPYGHVID